MKTTIYYFSGTGNSLKIARDIAARLGDTTLIPVGKAINEPLDLSADRIGLVFPVYMWGMPDIIARFARRLTVGSDKYLFAVVNYGGFPGATLPSLAKTLKKQGSSLSASFGIKMPGNYIPMYGARPETELKTTFEKASGKVAAIVAAITKGERTKPVSSGFPLDMISSLVYAISMPRIHTMDKSFVVQDTCTSCNICFKICPVDNIKMANGRPVWQGKCEQCMACIQFCPVEAIQYGKKTPGRKRYHNPDVKVAEMMCR
jgi:ferredoxin